MPESERSSESLCRRHLVFGWWSLLLFLSLGIVLEALHGLKLGWYLDTTNETRRLMFTLAHAHGTLLSLVHIAFALTVRAGAASASGRQQLASALLRAATVLLPGGFLLGGLKIYGGDPGLGVFLVPVGGLVLLAAVLCIARSLGSAPLVEADEPPVPAKAKNTKRKKR